MDVVGVGSDVRLKCRIPAVITAICIRYGRHVTYECQWWKDGTCNVQWFERFQFEVNDSSYNIKIGFK